MRRLLASRRLPRPLSVVLGSSGSGGGSKRSYNFASSSYLKCFGDVPIADGVKLRADTIAYMDAFDPQSWYDDPVTSVVAGQPLTGGSVSPTVDAFQVENGSIRHATASEVQAIVAHMGSFAPEKDYRAAVRAAEEELFADHSAFLIGNQALDFHKQDGVTEIEESVQANLVEQRMNDLLLADESAGSVKVCRSPSFVACVSNFTNFLDLSRKTLRNIELGVPVVVLSRSNTTQHMYRWAVLLMELLGKHGAPKGLVTYAACGLEDQQKLFRASPEGAVYITSSRPVAATVRAIHGNVLASTGGPNTLVAPALTPEIADATKLSAMIENSGQCTALRHVCIGGGGGGVSEADIEAMFEDAPKVSSPVDALRTGSFAAIFDGGDSCSSSSTSSSSSSHAIRSPFELAPGYVPHPKHGAIAYRLNGNGAMPPDGIDEHWRQTYVDVSTPADPFGSDGMVAELAGWLVRNQPISTAMNTKGSSDQDLAYARSLFERTSQVVYTVGYEGSPALTCQARPQEGEIFGEFPERRDLGKYTKYPVVIPSSTPAYNAHYEQAHLVAKATKVAAALEAVRYRGKEGAAAAAYDLIHRVESVAVRGFCVLLLEYLADATKPNTNPSRGDSANTGGPNRSILFGLQRPPMDGSVTLLRCGAATPFDALAPTLLPFLVTNAAGSVCISVDPANSALVEQLQGEEGGAAWLRGTPVTVESQADFEGATSASSSSSSSSSAPVFYNVVPPEALADNNNTNGVLEAFPLAQQFVSLYLPMGHIKSVRSDDEPFLKYFAASGKWLRLRDD